MIVLKIVRSSSKMSTVAPVVSEIFEKTGAYVNRMFLQKKFFFQILIKIETKIINKLRVAMETVSRAYFACIVKFLFFELLSIYVINFLQFKLLNVSHIF